MSAGRLKVWITRALPAAEATAARVAALGFEPILEPLLEVRFLTLEIDLEGVAALAFTSANGVRAFAQLDRERTRRVWTVGAATAQAAREAGFGDVRSADGDVNALAGAILGDPPGGVVLHLSAREPAGDLVGALRAGGLEARRAAVYETMPTALALSASAAPVADVVLLHSPRAARLLAAFRADGRLSSLRAVCLSPAVAAGLEGALPSVSAANPDETALLAALQELAR